MTDPAIIAASYAAERNYSHNPDNVIDASGAVLAIGTEKVDTTTLKDRSLTGNDATIHGAMPAEGFIQGRRFDADNENYLDCGQISLASNFCIHSVLSASTTQTHSFVGIYIDALSRIEGVIAANIIYYAIGNGVSFGDAGFGIDMPLNTIQVISAEYKDNVFTIYRNGIADENTVSIENGNISSETADFLIGTREIGSRCYDGKIFYTGAGNVIDIPAFFNIFARLPFWSVNYTDYPNNVTEYTDNLPYSSSIISSGTFKVDDDKLQCVSAGTMTYSASYEFDGSEYIKVVIDGVEYAGTGTITQGNTTVSVAQGSNKVTIQMGTGDTIEGEIDIQFREEV